MEVSVNCVTVLATGTAVARALENNECLHSLAMFNCEYQSNGFGDATHISLAKMLKINSTLSSLAYEFSGMSSAV